MGVCAIEFHNTIFTKDGFYGVDNFEYIQPRLRGRKGLHSRDQLLILSISGSTSSLVTPNRLYKNNSFSCSVRAST